MNYSIFKLLFTRRPTENIVKICLMLHSSYSILLNVVNQQSPVGKSFKATGNCSNSLFLRNYMLIYFAVICRANSDKGGGNCKHPISG